MAVLYIYTVCVCVCVYAVSDWNHQRLFGSLIKCSIFSSLAHQGFCAYQSREANLSQLINQTPKQSLVCDPQAHMDYHAMLLTRIRATAHLLLCDLISLSLRQLGATIKGQRGR